MLCSYQACSSIHDRPSYIHLYPIKQAIYPITPERIFRGFPCEKLSGGRIGYFSPTLAIPLGRSPREKSPPRPPLPEQRSVRKTSLYRVDKPPSRAGTPPFPPLHGRERIAIHGLASAFQPNDEIRNKRHSKATASKKPEGYATSNTHGLDRFYRLASLRAAVALIPISLPTSAQGSPLARSSRACARRCSAVSR